MNVIAVIVSRDPELGRFRLRFKGTIKPSLDNAIYALKVLAKNNANTHLVNVGAFLSPH